MESLITAGPSLSRLSYRVAKRMHAGWAAGANQRKFSELHLVSFMLVPSPSAAESADRSNQSTAECMHAGGENVTATPIATGGRRTAACAYAAWVHSVNTPCGGCTTFLQIRPMRNILSVVRTWFCRSNRPIGRGRVPAYPVRGGVANAFFAIPAVPHVVTRASHRSRVRSGVRHGS